MSVETDNGRVLYVAVAPSPLDAEDLVRERVGVPLDREVWAENRAPPDAVQRFGLGPGDLKGPM